ncbi:MAG: HEAT repeat domain-containing protein [Phycisphaerae bacterium]
MNARLKHRVALLVGLACASGFFGGSSPSRAAGRNPALSTPDLLVDLARDYGLRRRGKQTPADVLHIKTLLRAAVRLEPRRSQALVWLYELAARGAQAEEAAEMLAQLVAAAPTNMTALANWLEAGPPDVQTLEQRQAWLVELLGRSESPENLALVHTHLARLALQQVDRQRARGYLDEALRLWPACPDALLLGLKLVTPEAPLAERLGAVLRALRANPVQVELAWEAGLLLDEYGFGDDAFSFYEHALSVHAAAGPASPLPSEKLLQLSRNALARKQIADAVRYAQQAAQAEQSEQGTYEARFYLYWLLDGRVPPAIIERYKAELAQPFAAVKDPTDWPVGVVSQAAWFYCVIDEQPQRALMLAADAARRAPGDVFATRVLGWSQALNGRAEEARQTLTPIARTDPYAAYRLATLLRDAGDENAPARLVGELAYVPPVGRARQLLDELKVPMAASQPADQRFPEVVRLLAEFDREVLEFHQDPPRFLKAEIKLDDPSLAPGEPWWAVFSLTNRGHFPITLGPDWMLNPVFLLSFHIEGDRIRDYPNLLTVSLDHARVIQPGETLRVRRTIDIGPLRKLSRRTPQQLQTISMTAILDPQQTPDGQWQASATGQELRATLFVRLPANTDPEAWHARFSALKGESSRARFRALEVMAQLLGERQRARLKPLAYRPQAIPAERVHGALLNALGSESWEIRVRALDALQAAGLDRALFDAAQQCLEHPHWLVRMMAVRLLARQGKAFAETARRMAAEDEDELVRSLARSYLARWSGASSATTRRPNTP